MSEEATRVTLTPQQAEAVRAECARRHLTCEQGIEQALAMWRVHPEGLALEVAAFRRIWSVLAAHPHWTDDTLIAIARICLETGIAIPGDHLSTTTKGTA